MLSLMLEVGKHTPSMGIKLQGNVVAQGTANKQMSGNRKCRPLWQRSKSSHKSWQGCLGKAFLLINTVSELSLFKSQNYLEGGKALLFCASQICSFPLQLPTYSFLSQKLRPPPHQNLGTLLCNITLSFQMHIAMNKNL